MSTSRRVLITGATGALGPAVIAAFLDEGWTIRTLSRRPPSAESPAAALPHVAADVTDRAAVRRALEGVDVVVHLAALLHVIDPSRALDAEYRRVNVEGTRTLLEAARSAAVPRLVYVSSIAVYGANRGLVDEQTPPAPDTAYAASKLEGEHAVLNDSGGGVVLRLAAVYGAGIKGNYDRLVRAIARGRFIPIGRGENRRTLVHETDIARAIVLAATHPSAIGQIFNVTDGQIHTVSEIASAIAGALGRPPQRLAIPLWVARMGVASVEPVFRLLGKRAPVTSSTLDKYTEDVAVEGRRIRDVLGFHPRLGLAEGWERTIAEMRSLQRL